MQGTQVPLARFHHPTMVHTAPHRPLVVLVWQRSCVGALQVILVKCFACGASLVSLLVHTAVAAQRGTAAWTFFPARHTPCTCVHARVLDCGLAGRCPQYRQLMTRGQSAGLLGVGSSSVVFGGCLGGVGCALGKAGEKVQCALCAVCPCPPPARSRPASHPGRRASPTTTATTSRR